MIELRPMFFRQLKFMLYFLSLLVAGYGLTPYKTVFAGLILGTSFSLYKLWSTYLKVKRFGDGIVEKKRAGGLGTIQRIAVSGLAVLIAMRFPAYFHLVSVVLGLMTYYMVIMIDYFIQALHNKSRKRGE